MKLWKYGEIGEPRIVDDVLQIPSLHPDYLDTLKASEAFGKLDKKDTAFILKEFDRQSRYWQGTQEAEPSSHEVMGKPEDGQVKVIGRDV